MLNFFYVCCRWRNKAKDKNAIHYFVQQIENGERIAAFAPGNVIHIQIKKKTHNWLVIITHYASFPLAFPHSKYQCAALSTSYVVS